MPYPEILFDEKGNPRIVWIAYILLATDWILTRYAIINGLAIEGNPILVTVMSSNFYTFLALVLIFVLFKIITLAPIDKRIYALFYLIILSRLIIIGVHLNYLLRW